MVKLILQQNLNPYFNIASEEYLLRSFSDDFIYIYRCSPSIVVGKHQNTFAEINIRLVEQRSIPVVRRLSGGGAVFHDLGNINFCFISNGVAGQLVNFKRFTLPIIEFLQDLGVDACLGPKHDIRVADRKISGNASYAFGNRVMHHGTLLYSSDLELLNEAIRVESGRFTGSAVQSNRSSVANVVDFLPSKIDVEQFAGRMMEWFTRKAPDGLPYQFSNFDNSAVDLLVKEKYGTWSWNYGFSPPFERICPLKTSLGNVVIRIRVVQGYVENTVAESVCDKRLAAWVNSLLGELPGKKYSRQVVAEALKQSAMANPDLTLGVSGDELMTCLIG
jgi:lipoate-protein ligase A